MVSSYGVDDFYSTFSDSIYFRSFAGVDGFAYRKLEKYVSYLTFTVKNLFVVNAVVEEIEIPVTKINHKSNPIMNIVTKSMNLIIIDPENNLVDSEKNVFGFYADRSFKGDFKNRKSISLVTQENLELSNGILRNTGRICDTNECGGYFLPIPSRSFLSRHYQSSESFIIPNFSIEMTENMKAFANNYFRNLLIRKHFEDLSSLSLDIMKS
jgi:hypothetical protein